MNTQKNKILPAIILLSILTGTALMAITPSANAAVVQIDTYAHTMIAPNPAGVNQKVLVTFQIDKVSPTANMTANHFTGFTVTITRPDNKTETTKPYEAFSMSSAYFYYTPDQVGTYYFQTNFPGQWINYTSAGRTYQNYYKPSTSSKTALIVQQDPVQGWQDSPPLPTDYWTRPIYAENKGWGQISDNWLMVGYDYTVRSFTIASTFAPYTSAPNSAHVLWTKPLEFGGLPGGMYGDDSYYTGLSYEQFYNPLIINGRIIYTEHTPYTTAALGTHCIDLYTGKEIWFINNTAIAFGEILQFDSPNEHGALPILWSTAGFGSNTTWTMYDAFSGTQYLQITNVTMGSAARRGATVFGPNGEILSFTLNSNGRWLAMWNSTLALIGPPTPTDDYFSPTKGSIINGNRGLQWNVSIPTLPAGTSIWQVNGGYILAASVDMNYYPPVLVQMAFSTTLSKNSTGQYPTSIAPMWIQNRTDVYMVNPSTLPKFSNILDGIYTMFDEGQQIYHAYSITSGQELWQTATLDSGWATYNGYTQFLAYGMLYTSGFDGHVRAYNDTTGTKVWDYYFGSAGYETAYGSWPSYSGFNIADGKLFIANDEHSPDSVMWRGAKLTAIDAYTGKGLWNISDWAHEGAIADGYVTALNSYDEQIYTFGKGPSKTTVTAPQTIVPLGTGVMITGSVTDQSPGQPDTPAISDTDMTAWMEYLHMQKQIPVNATGVPVKLTAVAPDGSTTDIGTTTSDIGGSYGIMWTPTLEGKYYITATFAGSESYGSSYATTYLGVGPAPSSAPSATPSPTATPTAAPTLTPAVTNTPSPAPVPSQSFQTEIYIAAATVAIVVFVVAAAVMLRRRTK